MVTGRADKIAEVSPRWAAQRLRVHPRTLRRWCTSGRVQYLRVEYGLPGCACCDGEPHVKRYWLSRVEVEQIVESMTVVHVVRVV